MDYSKTLNLPRTKFPMKADLAMRESALLKFWEEQGIYKRIQEKNSRKPKYILHDGPPYANGRIHLGHALNKILKDIVVKFKSLNGYDAPFVPGWDTHGLPIELATIKEHKVDRRNVNPIELRQQCKKLALHFMEVQKEQFKRLGIFGDWEKPYLTLDPKYEAAIIKTFGEMALKNYIYRGKKPVYWCYHCETSLAEAEIEYQEKHSPSIYVKFPLVNKYEKALPNLASRLNQTNKKAYVVIWTTTPWTLPANVAIALHPAATYIVADTGNEYLLTAEALWEATAKAAGINSSCSIIDKTSGKNLLKAECKHPFIDRASILVTEEYVTMDQGTGCVHTAPGHGADDFEASRRHNLPILVPVDSHGILTNEAGPFNGLSIENGNKAIVDYLKDNNFLLNAEETTHSYPHCWRCHKPVIFRATNQWFIAMDHPQSQIDTKFISLRDATSKVISLVKWFPYWGEERIYNMVQDRPDWCISRQRVWGVPLPVFYCKNCNESIITRDSIDAVTTVILKEGSDAWFTKEANELLPSGFICPKCSHTEFIKEQDIFDVWFESGVSHLAVLEQREELAWPANLYLEGSDQYRGWFQVSLLTGMAMKGESPYKEVVTNGWVLDSEGKAMHKSLGNVIDPMDIVNTYGADLLRLYFASIEFKNDVKIGTDIIKQTGEIYRQIRNTCRFILGNLDKFNPVQDKLTYEEITATDFGAIDRWALDRMQRLILSVTEAYNKYDFHLALAHIQQFCVKDMSEFYLDILKDRLYTYSLSSQERRAACTVLYEILSSLVRLIYPILSFTAEEIWQHLPWYNNLSPELSSIALTEWPNGNLKWQNDSLKNKFEKILNLRREVYVSIEELRKNKKIGRSEEILIEFYPSSEDLQFYKENAELLRAACKVSGVKILQQQEQSPFKVLPHTGRKCERCWYFFYELSDHEAHPTLCKRCLNEVTSPIHSH